VLQHVSLEVHPDEAPALAEFWTLLGFHEVEPPGPLQGHVTWLERGPTQIHLLHTDTPTAPQAGHSAIVADDFEATLDRLREHGFDPQQHPDLWGAQRWFVRGPAGHLVEVMERPPPTGQN
jgi:catechol 2,3-dioxygenase-like lactoylglutathione lyase family enzyme